MGWLDEQLNIRKKADEEMMEEALFSLSGVITGRQTGTTQKNTLLQTQHAMGDILAYFRIPMPELSETIQNLEAQVDALLRPSGIMHRRVKLKEDWYNHCIGPLLGTTKSGHIVALMPKTWGGYQFFDVALGKTVTVNAKTASHIQDEAYCFYRSFASKPIGMIDFFKFMLATIAPFDVVFFLFVTLAATAVSLLFPYINDQLFGIVIPSSETYLLASVAFFMVGILLSSTLFNIVKSLLVARIQTKLDIATEAATMMRILSLPAEFFKRYSPGELNARMKTVSELCHILVDVVFGIGIPSLFSFLYIVQISVYTPSLVWVVLLTAFLSFSVSFAYILAQIKRTNRLRAATSKLEGIVFSLFSGVQKIKLAGAEKRAFARWAKTYKTVASLQYKLPAWFRILPGFARFIRLFGLVFIYYFAVVSQISVAEFMVFNAAYGLFMGAMESLEKAMVSISGIPPILEMVKPILQEVPEISQGKKTVEKLQGGIDVSHISFQYSRDMPPVLDDISFSVLPGQYVAIVGTTGCGKSTLLRLLLGFETPQKGAIYYDKQDMTLLNLRTLRRNIGVVMQTGKVFQGDVYHNIVITQPTLTMARAWEAAEMANLAEDIRRFPMGMHTMISEGGGGISGGQRQRLMIARAIAPKPQILMFDEATSALDNLTQKKISTSLSKLHCTRIVIAHRLSTVRECDRILVLHQGNIVEDGTYEELLTKDGHFAELVKRQRLDLPL